MIVANSNCILDYESTSFSCSAVRNWTNCYWDTKMLSVFLYS